ncbi:alpha/beta hydrolase family protein [Paenibacillus ginsengarvi]|uniref:Acetylxylan esterase n=1 Tax=Paenibacillus ginsengarvi TaxID=400777 RepID=A0A3B0BZJ3_9BACL|nr:alpha/beta hydrolase family protein [Paenibacillus ginsengarvi]RKN79023.1 hypothetical protein D7M11_21880 [Paenibacillus ginsengarvi]
MIYFPADRYTDNLYNGKEREFSYANALQQGRVEEWRAGFRSRLTEMTGLAKVRSDTAGLPLSPRIVERREYPEYVREKIYVATEPGIDIPFYLLLPAQGTGPFPLVLTPHGHGRRGKEVYVGEFESEEERRESLDGDRDIALQAVAQGYAVMAMDVRGFWEMAREEEVGKKQNNSCDALQKRAFLFGRTLIGERVHDMGRLIDYAATRPEIDTNRIAITGNSGGGTVSLFTAALDERIRVCVPGSYFCTFRASLLSVNHCLCNFIPGLVDLCEMYDIAGLVAPRPLLVVHGEHDSIYPADATREAFSHVRELYEAIGAPDRCELYVGDGGHRYYKAPVWPFMAKYL